MSLLFLIYRSTIYYTDFFFQNGLDDSRKSVIINNVLATSPANYERKGGIMTVEQWARIDALRTGKWAPDGEEEPALCVAEPETVTTVTTKRVAAPYADDVRYYRCGGGRRVIRKKIGGD